MELLKGYDLDRHIKTDSLLDILEVLRIVTECAEALDYAHSQNVVHRDIKPSNIMYDPDSGAVKITDFGIARITDSSKTRTGTVLGTPNYMSPEQCMGKRVDGRSDLFSLGVVLYQLVSGAALPGGVHGDADVFDRQRSTDRREGGEARHSPNVAQGHP